MRYFVFAAIVCMLLAAGCGEDDEEIADLEDDIEALERRNETLQAGLRSLTHENEGLIQEKASAKDQLWEAEHSAQSSTLVKGSITIRANNYADYPFSVSSDMSNVSVKGDFQSISGGDLYVYVFDDLNFRNWKAYADSKSLYKSGKAVVGKIDVSIGAAEQYHLVFSNTHSWITKKIVRAEVILRFDR